MAGINLIDNIRRILDNGEYALAIFLDLKKAFDTVNHKILLSKLDYYGFRGISNTFFHSYLSDRHQYTIFNGIQSRVNVIDTGVPQGSVLGPLFFLLYVNDITTCLTHQKVTLFADDTSVLLHNKDLSKLKKESEDTLSKLYDWLICNKLSINWKKTNYLIFHHKNRLIPNDLNYIKLNNDNMIKRVEHTVYLGITIDEHLTWEKHIRKLCQSLSSCYNMFYNLRYKITNEFKKRLYYALVYSRISYGIELYGSCSKTLLNRVQTTQNKLIKVLFHLPFRTNTNVLLSELKFIKCKDIYEQTVSKLVYPVVKNECIPQLKNYFKDRNTVHDINTRHKNLLIVPKIKNKFGENSVFYQGASIWNKIDNDIRESKSIYVFKRKLKQYYLTKYNY
jgi:hypothetical protein